MVASIALFERVDLPRLFFFISAAKAWVVHLACTKPKDLGYAAELWTRNSRRPMYAGMRRLTAIPICRAPSKPRCKEFSMRSIYSHTK